MKKRSQKYGQALSGAPSVPIERMFSARASAHRAAGIGYARAIHIYTYSKLTAIKSVNLSVVKSVVIG